MFDIYLRKAIDSVKTKNTLIEEYLLYRPGINFNDDGTPDGEMIIKIKDWRRSKHFDDLGIIDVRQYASLSNELFNNNHNMFRALSALRKGFRHQLKTLVIPSSEEISEALKNSELELSLMEPIYNKLPTDITKLKHYEGFRRNFLDHMNDFTSLWFEVLMLDWCLKQWLIPHKNGKDKIPSAQMAFSMPAEIYRCDTALVQLVLEDDLVAHNLSKRLYESRINEIGTKLWAQGDNKFEAMGKKITAAPHLVHVAWFEIAAAIDYNLHVGVCSCGGVFVQNKMKTKLICGDKACSLHSRKQAIFNKENRDRISKNLSLFTNIDDVVRHYDNCSKAISRHIQDCIAKKVTKEFIAERYGLSIPDVENRIYKKNKKSRSR